MVNKQRDLLKVRIELNDIMPPIWREILIPARYSFWDLHVAIQDAMGWWDSHLHEFRIDDPGREQQRLIGIPMDEDMDGFPETEPGWDIPVIDHLLEPGDHLVYEYDFGDSWVHDITLRSVESREKGRRYPQCVAGERACPPEDCGGIHGYASLLQTLLDPDDSEYEALSEWVPEGWGPELFRTTDVKFDNPTRRWKRAFESID